jgi:hypothetical protein
MSQITQAINEPSENQFITNLKGFVKSKLHVKEFYRFGHRATYVSDEYMVLCYDLFTARITLTSTQHVIVIHESHKDKCLYEEIVWDGGEWPCQPFVRKECGEQERLAASEFIVNPTLDTLVRLFYEKNKVQRELAKKDKDQSERLKSPVSLLHLDNPIAILDASLNTTFRKIREWARAIKCEVETVKESNDDQIWFHSLSPRGFPLYFAKLESYVMRYFDLLEHPEHHKERIKRWLAKAVARRDEVLSLPKIIAYMPLFEYETLRHKQLSERRNQFKTHRKQLQGFEELSQLEQREVDELVRKQRREVEELAQGHQQQRAQLSPCLQATDTYRRAKAQSRRALSQRTNRI